MVKCLKSPLEKCLTRTRNKVTRMNDLAIEIDPNQTRVSRWNDEIYKKAQEVNRKDWGYYDYRRLYRGDCTTCERQTSSVFTSDLVVLKDPVINVPIEVLDLCERIQRKLPGKEFSILLKGNWSSRGFDVGKEYVIPKQKVEHASVDYLEDLVTYRNNGFNTVVHSHPFNSESTTFSSSDEDTINSHFTCSLLYSNVNKFVDSTFLVKMNDDIRVSLKFPICITRNTESIFKEELLKNIEQNDYTTKYAEFNKVETHTVVDTPNQNTHTKSTQFGVSKENIKKITNVTKRNCETSGNDTPDYNTLIQNCREILGIDE